MDSNGTPPSIFSEKRRQAALARRGAAQAHPHSPTYLLDDMVEDVLDRLSFLRHAPASALIIGDWTQRIAPILGVQGCKVTSFDCTAEEQPITAGPFNLVVSLGRLDTVNDLPGALIHLRNSLATGGLMIASFPGAGCLPRLRSAMLSADGERPAARFHPMVDVRAGGQLLQRAGFAQPVVDTRSLRVRFSSITGLVSDLRAQGLGNVLANRAPPLSRSARQAASLAFMAAAEADGKTTETFEILTLSGWRQ